MSMKQIRDTYRVPAKRGRRILFKGRPGTITASDGMRLRAHLDDDPGLSHLLHPTWEVEYPAEPDEGGRTFKAGGPRVYHQGSSLVVIGTEDVPAACRAAGISPDTHQWERTDYGPYARRKHGWQDVVEYQPPKDARPGVVFVGPIRKRETPL